MADTKNLDFFLPSEFLTDDDILMDKININNHLFPSEFPYEFGSSTGSESEEDEFLAGLTRQLAFSTLRETQKIPYAPKKWVLSRSPQSTMSVLGSCSSNGSPNGPSPPTTPFCGINESWDLIAAAAGQVKRLKVYGDGPPKGRGLLAPPRIISPVYPSPPVKNPYTGVYAKPSQCLSHTLLQPNHFQQGRPTGLVQLGWPSVQVQSHHQVNHRNKSQLHGCSGLRPGFVGGFDGGVRLKRECAGTGVFLPRRYGNPTESRKKSDAVCFNPPLPTRLVQPKAYPHCNGGFIPDYDALMARRNALLVQQQKQNMRLEGTVARETRLPQEWTY